MFVKLYNSLILSSLWSEHSDTRVLWITMLAAADRDGYIFGSPAGLAALARLPVETVLKALAVFTEPDPLSTDLLRNPQNEGRRIEVVDGGWRLLNYEWYRGLERAEDRKAQYRESKRRLRAGKVDSPQMSRRVSKSPPSEAEAEAEAGNTNTGVRVSGNGSDPEPDPPPKKAKRRTTPFKRPTLAEVEAEIKARGFGVDPIIFFTKYEENGWMAGRNPMKNWHMAIANWERQGWGRR